MSGIHDAANERRSEATFSSIGVMCDKLLCAGSSGEDKAQPKAALVVHLQGPHTDERVVMTCSFDLKRGRIENLDIDSNQNSQIYLGSLDATATVRTAAGVHFSLVPTFLFFPSSIIYMMLQFISNSEAHCRTTSPWTGMTASPLSRACFLLRTCSQTSAVRRRAQPQD